MLNLIIKRQCQHCLRWFRIRTYRLLDMFGQAGYCPDCQREGSDD